MLGWPATRIGGAAGTLARSNAMRNPARTASTAAALMIGLALVTAFAVLGQGLKQSIIGSVTGEFRGDYVLTSENGFTPDLRRLGERLARRPASRRSSPASAPGQGRAFGQTVRVAGLDPGLSQLLRARLEGRATTARWRRSAANGAIVDDGFASSQPPRRRLAASASRHPQASTVRLKVDAIYTPPQAENPLGTVSISSRTFDALYPNPQNVFTLIATPGGVTAANTAALNRVLASFPDAKIQTEQQFINSQEASINSELNLLYILLALSIIVSLFGIVNTLVLTVFERTRELGMLRAIGMTRRQTRRMIRHEAVITALLGATLGIPVGIGLAALFDRALKGIPFAVPVGHDRRLRLRRDRRRPPRRDLPRPPRLAAQHPERAPVRVILPLSERCRAARGSVSEPRGSRPSSERRRPGSTPVPAVRSRLAPRAHARSATQSLLALKTTFVVEPARFAMMIVCWLTITPNPRRLLRRQTMSAFVDVVPA